MKRREQSWLLPARAAVFAAAFAGLVFGIWRGEAATVFNKAVRICLECIGIG